MPSRFIYTEIKNPGEETSKIFNFFINRKDGLNLPQLQGGLLNENLVLEDLLHLNTFMYETDIVDGEKIGKVALRNAEKHESTVRLLQVVILLCFSVSFVPKNPFIERTNTVLLRALLHCYAKVQKTVFSFPFSASICFQSYERRLSSRENQTNNLQIGFWTETLYKSSVFESRFLQRSSFQNEWITTRFVLKWKLSTSQVLIKKKTTRCRESGENFPSFFSLRQRKLQHEELRTKAE